MSSESDSNRRTVRSEEEESEDLFGSNFMDDYRSLDGTDEYEPSNASTEREISLSEYYRMDREVLNDKSSEEDINNTGVEIFASEFKEFLLTFENNKYINLIKKMCVENEESLLVDYRDLEVYSEKIVNSLLKNAEASLKLMDTGLNMAVKTHFPNYENIKPILHVRIFNLPVIESIRGLRNCHLNKLIKISGIVTRISSVLPQISIVKFTCTKCQAVFGPFTVDNPDFKPVFCYECQKKGGFLVNSKETIYKDHQKITIQEIPGTVPPGCLPRSKEVVCFYDLIDKARPGDEIELIGIYKNNFSLSLNSKNGFPVFRTVIEGNCILNQQTEFSTKKINEDDIKILEKLSKKENIKQLIFNSIAPSIYGHKDIKKSLALALFSGERKIFKDHTVRGDINVLLLGDPGTAKSQFLRYVQNLVHRAVLTTGQGASSVGLTATVQKDPVTREWCLEGGAMVLADKGICLIDEFDKMNEHDRVSIHEAMEQQTVSVSKAGIVTSLNAQCGVIAAANPIRGKYITTLNFNQNVNLSDPIISRFDILCVVKDTIEQEADTKMGSFVLENHVNAVSGNVEPEEEVKRLKKEVDQIPQEILKKYIIYARQNIHPKIKEGDLEKISHFYAEIRKESKTHTGIPITVRHIESIVRMSESFAKMRLSETVSQADIDDAIYVALNSFISAQKFSLTKSLRKKFSKYLLRNQDEDILFFILNDLFNEKLKFATNALFVDKNDFEKVVRGQGCKVHKGFYYGERFKGQYVVEDMRIRRVRAN